MSPVGTERIVFADPGIYADLDTYVQRARRVDSLGAIRLVGHDLLLAAYVGVLHGLGLPTVLGLRVSALGAPSRLDVTVELAALADRFARAVGATTELPVPAAQVAGVRWAGVSPPRDGWQPITQVDLEGVREVATQGVAAVASAGTLAALSARSDVWGSPWAQAGGAPRGLAFGAHALGFVPQIDDPDGAPAAVHRNGAWWRLSTSRGYVLARQSLLG